MAKGWDVLVVDLAFTPKWMMTARVDLGWRYVSGIDSDKPQGFLSIYSGFEFHDLITTEEADDNLGKLERRFFRKREWPGAQPALPPPPHRARVPPPPPPPVLHISMGEGTAAASSGSAAPPSSASPRGHGVLTPTDVEVLDALGVDAQARSALGVLANVDMAAKDGLVFKLVMKKDTALRNPSGFVMQSCLNAMRQHSLA